MNGNIQKKDRFHNNNAILEHCSTANNVVLIDTIDDICKRLDLKIYTIKLPLETAILRFKTRKNLVHEGTLTTRQLQHDFCNHVIARIGCMFDIKHIDSATLYDNNYDKMLNYDNKLRLSHFSLAEAAITALYNYYLMYQEDKLISPLNVHYASAQDTMIHPGGTRATMAAFDKFKDNEMYCVIIDYNNVLEGKYGYTDIRDTLRTDTNFFPYGVKITELNKDTEYPCIEIMTSRDEWALYDNVLTLPKKICVKFHNNILKYNNEPILELVYNDINNPIVRFFESDKPRFVARSLNLADQNVDKLTKRYWLK
jgi:hypothetical protein